MFSRVVASRLSSSSFSGLVEGDGVIVSGAQRGADGGEAVAVLREDGVLLVQLQRLHKPLPQPLQEVQGAAQKDDLALQLPALGQTGDGLVHHRLEDGRRHILLPAALVQDGLDVALGEHAAAAGDGVDLFVLQRQLVQLIAVTFINVAIWSMKAPVPPAQLPFMRSSRAPPKKMILASSPPSSMTASVPGM